MEKIILLGCTQNFPIEFSASNTKTYFIANGLVNQNCDVCIINSIMGCDIENDVTGTHGQIKYYTFSKRKNVFLTLLHNCKKLYDILKYEKNGDKNCIIYCYNIYPIFLLERFICFLCNYHFFCIIQEWHSCLKRKNKLIRIFDYLFDHTFGYFANGIFPISHKLQELCSHFNKQQLIVPVLSSYNDKCSQIDKTEKIFSYCCNINYLLRNDLIIKSFKLVITKYHDAKLNLILSGDLMQIKWYTTELKKNGLSNNINIKYQIKTSELELLYKNSLALLIPLNPTSFQDITRFSQKIAEYVSSERPIITNNVGEIPYYFNKESAIIVDYSYKSFADGMIWAIENPTQANEIGINGKKVGQLHFDYKRNGERIKYFINHIK